MHKKQFAWNIKLSKIKSDSLSSKVANLEPGQAQSSSLFISYESSPLKVGLLIVRTVQPGNNSKAAPKSSPRSPNCIACPMGQVGKLKCTDSRTYTLYNITYHALNVSPFFRRIISRGLIGVISLGLIITIKMDRIP